MPRISDPDLVTDDQVELVTLAFNRFESAFGTLGKTPFPGVYTSEARYLAVRIAIPHWFVRSTQVGSADSDRELNRTPTETFEEGGDCVDRCVLLGSLWATLSLPSELYSISSEDSDSAHLTAIATIPDVDDGPSPEAVSAELVRIYTDHLSRELEPTDIFSWTDDGELHLIADPVFSDHVGDIGSMVEHGFATVDGQGEVEWEFHNEIQDVVVPTGGSAYHRYKSM
ncbi:hypothetical protein DVK02_00695 [Halobellus sp. Atlit-31R]|nr:hypothetical protein DVK02_00695 [Halobellus sp. Atlit-31R]